MRRSIVLAAAHALAFGALGAVPVTAQAPPQFASLVLGEANTCGLTAEGVAYCWGDNTFGQLGDGTRDRRTIPTPVGGGLRFRLLSIAGSVDEVTDPFGRAVKDLKGVHVCGITTDSAAFCWGADAMGQVGAGQAPKEPRTTPTRVLADARFATLATNLGQSCAATTQGQAWCWGALGFRVEDGRTLQFYSKPVGLPAAIQIREFFRDELQICGLMSDGVGICWRGGEQRGGVHFREIKVADGRLQALTPARVRLGTGFCGIDENKRWLCWDQLASGPGVLTTLPEEEVPGVSFTAIRAIGDVRCGLAATGTLHCNVAGARGDSIAAPVPGETFASLVDAGAGIYRGAPAGRRSVRGGPTIIDEASGICGLRADGQGLCIRRLFTAPRNEGSSAAFEFVPVPGDLRWRTLHFGRAHSCGITLTQVTYCWGENGSGQLGDGSRSRRTEPVQVRFE